ncbi:hypothetical protein [Psychrobacillus sp. FSL H8-0510]
MAFFMGMVVSDVQHAGSLGQVFANAAEKNSYNQLNDYEVVAHVVDEGQSVWLLQRELNNGKYVADAVSLFPYANQGKDAGSIQKGEVIYLLERK